MNPLPDIRLPESLDRQFRAVERRLWQVESALALSVATAALGAGFVLVFLMDRFGETPRAIRIALFLLAMTAVAVAAGWWLQRWVIRRRDRRAIAGLVQNKFPKFGDRLLSIVELAAGRQPAVAYSYSPALLQAAVGQVAAEAEGHDFREAVATRLARRGGLTAGGVLLLSAAFFAVSPPVAENALARWARPFADLPRMTLVELAVVPEARVVPHGESFTVSGRIDYRSPWQPRKIHLAGKGTPDQVTEASHGEFHFALPGLLEDATLTLRAGDDREALAVRPVHRPLLRDVQVIEGLPEYLRYPMRTNPVSGAELPVLAGSNIRLTGRGNREFAEVSLRLDNDTILHPEVQEEEFLSPQLAADEILQLTLNWRDKFGLTNAVPRVLTVKRMEDAAPEAILAGMPTRVGILPTEVLEVDVLAHDDFGVRESGLAWRIASATNGLMPLDSATSVPEPDRREMRTRIRFSPLVQGVVPGQVAELRATAVDWFPQRPPAFSEPLYVEVVDPEVHAELVRQILESLLIRLEEITREEQDIAESTRQNLESLELPEQQTLEATEIRKSADEQRAASEDLRRLANAGMQTLRQAMRNPVFQESALREWAENLASMNELASKAMPEVAGQLEAAAADPASSKSRLAGALENAQSIIEQLAAMQKSVTENLDQLQALTLSERLLRLSRKEKEVVEGLKRIAPATIGMSPEDLSAKYLGLNRSLAEDQRQHSGQTADLHEEISRFAERTRLETYQEVDREMEEAEIGKALEALAEWVDENRAMASLENLNLRIGQLEEWAERLHPPESDGAAGGDGGGNQGGDGMSPQQLMEVLIGLIRNRQEEVTLQAQTRSLADAGRLSDSERQTKAEALAERQGELYSSTFEIHQINPVPMVGPVLGETLESMQTLQQQLNRSEFSDESTASGFQKTVSLLTDAINLINEFFQQPPSSSNASQANAAQMEFLMQLGRSEASPGTALQPGSTPGGMTGGAPGAPLPAGAAGMGVAPEAGARQVERTAGRVTETPAEFRDALENYFRAIERSGLDLETP